MRFPDLLPELIDQIFAALLETIGPVKTLRLRVVNQFFNETILRAVTDSYVRDRNGPFHYWLDTWIVAPKNRRWGTRMRYRRVAPPIMSLFIEAEMRSDSMDLPLLALKEVLQVLNDLEPVLDPEEDRRRAKRIYEAAANFLDWDDEHKFAPSWLGNTPRVKSLNVDEKKQSLLGAAIVVGSVSTIQTLLEDTTIDVNHQSPYLGAPLQLAARRGDVAILELLLNHGADPRIIQVQSYSWNPSFNISGKACWSYWTLHGTALQVSSLSGNLDIVHLLLNPEYALPHPQVRCALYAAAQNGHVAIIDAVLDAYPDFDTLEARNSIFFQGCKYGRIEVVQKMIAAGVSPTVEKMRKGSIHGVYRIHGHLLAAWRGHTSILRLLLDHLVQIPLFHDKRVLLAHLRESMNLAFRFGQTDCMEVLFHLDCFPKNEYGVSRIISMISHVPVFRLLVRMGLDLNTRSSPHEITLGQRVLLEAIRYGREEIVRALLEMGVSPNCPDQRTHPTLLAKIYGVEYVRKTLLAFGGEEIEIEESVLRDEVREGTFPDHRYHGKMDPRTRGWSGSDF